MNKNDVIRELRSDYGTEFFRGKGSLEECIKNGELKQHTFYVSMDHKYNDNDDQTKIYGSYLNQNDFWKFTRHHQHKDPMDASPFYEIIRDNLPCKLYADLEWKLDWKSVKEIKGIITKLLIDQLAIMKQPLNVSLEELDFIFLDASEQTTNKGSLHLICNDIYFNNVDEQKRFWNEIYVTLKKEPLLWFVDDTYPSYIVKTFVDFGVYNKNRQMRMIFSPKMKNGICERPLLPKVTPKKISDCNKFIISGKFNTDEATKLNVSNLASEIVCCKKQVWNKHVIQHYLDMHNLQVTVNNLQGNLITLKNKTSNRACELCNAVHTSNNAYAVIRGNELFYHCHSDKSKGKKKMIGKLEEDVNELEPKIPFLRYQGEHEEQVTDFVSYNIWFKRVMKDINRYASIIDAGAPYILYREEMIEDTNLQSESLLEPIKYNEFRAKSIQNFLLVNDCYKVRTNFEPGQTQTSKPQFKSIAKLWFNWNGHQVKQGEMCSPNKINENKINTFRGIRITRELAFEKYNEDYDIDANDFFKFYRNNACENDIQFNFLIKWLAHLIQKPGLRMKTVPVFRGDEGIGKGMLMNKIKEIVGDYNFWQPSHPSQLEGFNHIIAGKLLIYVDEMVWGGDKKCSGTLKKFITEETITVEEKMCPRRIIDNVTNIFMSSNEDHVIPAGMTSRRFHVYDMNNTFIKMDKNDKKNIYNTCPYAVARYLYNVDIKDFVPYEESVESTGLTFQKIQSMDSMQKWWTDLLTHYYDNEGDGFENKVKFGEKFQKAALYEHYKHSVKMYAKSDKILWRQLRTYVTYDNSKEEKLLVADIFGEKKRLMFCVLPRIEECIMSWNKLFNCEIIPILTEREIY